MNLAQLIEATEAANNQLRSEAEAQLMQARDQSPALFILACSEEFAKKNLPDLVRPKAGILIKYTLLNSGDADKLWTSIDQDTRERTKKNILATLAYPNDPIRNVAADLISIIYSVEYVQNEWQDLIPSLTNNTNHSEPEIKKSAILTLGKLCDQFKTKKLTMHKDVANQVLGGIYFGMQENETDEIKDIAVRALTDSLGFVKELFQDQNVRQQVVKLLLQACISQNRKVKTDALQCLIEFVRIYYEYLGEIYGAVWDATSNLIVSNDKELAILGIEVWNTIANEDKEGNSAYQKKSLGITAEVDKVLVPALLQNLLEGSKYEDDDEGGELNIISATKSCLISIAEATKERFLEYAIKFVGTYLLSQNNLELRAGLITYACMLDGPSPQSLAQLVTQAIPTIVMLLANNQNMLVKESAAIALERTAEIIPQVYFQDPLFSNIFLGLVSSIESHPRISLHITKLWHYLGEEISKKQQQNQTFNIDLTQVIDLLIKNAFRELDKTYYILIDHSLLAVMTLLLCTTKEDVKGKYVRGLVEQFKRTGEVSGDKRDLIQAGLLACLQTLLHKFQFDHLDPIVEDIFNLIIEMFSAYNNVTADGIYVLGALASAMGPAFKPYSGKAWPCVAEGFKLCDQPELFLATLNAIVELSGACPEDTVEYLRDIFDNLLSLLDRKDYDKALKLRIIIAIGDISLGCKDLILPYVEKLIRMYEMAMNAALTVPTNETPEMVEYLEQLRENILESYICFFHAVSESSNPQGIINSLPSVMTFLNQTCTQQYNPTVDYMRNALNLVADIGLIFKNRATQFLQRDLIANLIKVLEGFQGNPDNVAALEYAKKVLTQIGF